MRQRTTKRATTTPASEPEPETEPEHLQVPQRPSMRKYQSENDIRQDKPRTSALFRSSTTARTMQHSLGRAFSVLTGGSPVQQTVYCHICFEHVREQDTVKLAACGHPFCEQCLRSYLELKITEGHVYPMCFHPIGNVGTKGEGKDDDGNEEQQRTCGVKIDAAQIEAIVSPQFFAKYKLFRFNQEEARARQCPYCSHSQLCEGAESPMTRCEKCSEVFCFTHGNAHNEATTCADYELKHAKTESQSRATIARVAKKCPGCQSNVEKNGGCNHMTCVVCSTNFCWLCGKTMQSVSDHYDPLGMRSCAGMQFTNAEYDQSWIVRLEDQGERGFHRFWVLYGRIITKMCELMSSVLLPVLRLFTICFTRFNWVKEETVENVIYAMAFLISFLVSIKIIVYITTEWVPPFLYNLVMTGQGVVIAAVQISRLCRPRLTAGWAAIQDRWYQHERDPQEETHT